MPTYLRHRGLTAKKKKAAMCDYYGCNSSTFVVYNVETELEVCVCSDFDTDKLDENGDCIFTEDAEERAQMIVDLLNAHGGRK